MTDPGIDSQLAEATERHLAGDLGAARAAYARLLARAPGHPVASFRAGLLELQYGNHAAALQLIDVAAAVQPDEPRHQMGRGQALQALRRWDEAAAAYESALRVQPQAAEAWVRLGDCRQLAGRLEAAATAYRRALALRPDDPHATSNLGIALQGLDRLDEAVQLLRAALALQPAAVTHAVNLGVALCRRRDFAAAAAVLGRACAEHPRDAAAAFNHGIALHALGRSSEAADRYRRAAQLRPAYGEALNNLGNVLMELGEFPAALAAYEAAVAAEPTSVVALNNTGCLLRKLGRIDESEDVLRRGLAIDPAHAASFDNLGNALKDGGDIDAAIECYRRSLQLDPNGAATHGNLAYSLSFTSLAAQPVLDECRRWNERFAAPLRPARPPAPPDPSPERRLRIGYVSPDFRDHCQTLFTTPLLAHHDHERFDIHCYASVRRPDQYTRRLSGMADAWHDVSALDDAALAGVIGADRIDILVDLTMHMAGGRPLLFARQPAPVQVAWLAYPGTTGLGAMQYRLSDPRLDPPGGDEPYSERTVRLPDSFWCYDPLADGPPVSPLPALARGHITFGCLNNPCKLTETTLRLWGGVLGALPTARLVLLAPPGRHRQRLVQRLAAHGVDAARLTFVPFRPRAEYLRGYHDIDLGLDTLPYNGHTTSLDALWMGVPVITRIGATCVGRGGLSQSYQLQLPELAAAGDAGFVDAAVAFAGDVTRLADLRQRLRGRLTRSPLMDGARFARNLEDAYRRMWRSHCGA